MIDLRLVTPHADGFEKQVDKVIVRGILGDLMLMENTAPIVTPLAYNTMKVYMDCGVKVGVVHGGYVSMKDNVATVATAFEWTYDIDATRAQKAKDRAEAWLREAESKGEDTSRQSYKEAKLSLLRAINRLNNAEI